MHQRQQLRAIHSASSVYVAACCLCAAMAVTGCACVAVQNSPFYSNDELFVHLLNTHKFCQLCKKLFGVQKYFRHQGALVSCMLTDVSVRHFGLCRQHTSGPRTTCVIASPAPMSESLITAIVTDT